MAPDRRVLRIFAFSLITMLFLAESGVCGGLFESAWSKQMKRIHQLIKDEPANAHAYFERAGIYSSQISTCLNCNDDDKTLFEKALADYTKAVTLNNCFYEAYMGRSALYEDKGLLQEFV